MEAVFSNNHQHSQRFLILILLSVFFAAGVSTALIAETRELFFLNALPQVCPLKILTGYLCSFCGMTHAWIYFWHGDFALAEAENALSSILYFGTPLFLLSLVTTSFWSRERMQKSSWAVMSVLVFYTVARNLK